MNVKRRSSRTLSSLKQIDREARENMERLRAEARARREAGEDDDWDDDFDDDDYDVEVEYVR